MPKEWNGYADDTCIHKHSFLLTLRSKVTKKGSSLHCLVQKQDYIFSILKTQPRLHDLENSATENKASWQEVD